MTNALAYDNAVLIIAVESLWCIDEMHLNKRVEKIAFTTLHFLRN
jgi:hypothetical protein